MEKKKKFSTPKGLGCTPTRSLGAHRVLTDCSLSTLLGASMLCRVLSRVLFRVLSRALSCVLSGVTLSCHSLVSLSGFTLWCHSLVSLSGFTLWCHSLVSPSRSLSGVTFWCHSLAGRHNLRSFLAANLTQNYFLIARMLRFL